MYGVVVRCAAHIGTRLLVLRLLQPYLVHICMRVFLDEGMFQGGIRHPAASLSFHTLEEEDGAVNLLLSEGLKRLPVQIITDKEPVNHRAE